MALTLSKTNIANGNTIQAADVSQSIDALTGTVAYDITISGSLQLTGSVKSRDGYTGSLFGIASTASYVVLAQTASYVVTAQTASYVVLSQTASYVVTAQTASFVALAKSSSYVALGVNDISANDATITWTKFNTLSYNFTINNVTSSISSSLAASSRKLTTDVVSIDITTYPPSTPYPLSANSPAMVYLDFKGSTTNNIGISTSPGMLGQIVTFNTYFQEFATKPTQISLTGSSAIIYGLGAVTIPISSNNILSNLFFGGPPVTDLYSFSFQYTTLQGNTGWFLVNISKAS